MLTNHAYYALKPIIPLGMRLAMRRIRARRIAKQCGSYWPIHEATGRAPEGWPGWPGGKRFAFVLTHDVEGLAGVERCRQLAEIEMECGFRSAFNFVPQGDYEVPRELLGFLRENGFEIGVHDLRHDGTLFRTREGFRRDSQSINAQLKAWDAVGFRAGFMLHKLDWLHDLAIEYDSSTFDIDPFEPQPDGTQTVFPFWVPRPDPEADAFRGKNQPAPPDTGSGRSSQNAGNSEDGYIELPYTLVQDYNLFVVLQQPGIEIWRKKLAWLAAKGAMAMVDTHPDYMAMPGCKPGQFQFPVERYRELLRHVSTDYAGQYWAALPREVAAYCRTFKPKQARPPRQVAMLGYTHYDYDNRVRRYAETLVRRGDRVRVYCLGVDEQVRAQKWDKLCGVDVLRFQTRATREKSKWLHAWRLISFLWEARRHLSSKNMPEGCDLLHVHNIPDFLVFAGLPLKLQGTPIILDIHDIVPELFESKFKARHGSFLVTILKLIERWSCAVSNHVIVANHIWKKTVSDRSAPLAKVTALVNNVDLDLFSPKPRTRTDDRIVLLYPGTLNYHQGLDIAIRAMEKLSVELPKIELHIYGGGPALPALKELAQQLKLEHCVKFLGGVHLEQVSHLMANADIGIVPKRADGFGDQAYSTKIMEFMSQSLPVVLSRTRIDSLYFDESTAAFFESGNPEDLARAVRAVVNNPEYRKQLGERGFAYARANSWETMKHVYLDVVDRLTTTNIPRPITPSRSEDSHDLSVGAPTSATTSPARVV